MNYSGGAILNEWAPFFDPLAKQTHNASQNIIYSELDRKST